MGPGGETLYYHVPGADVWMGGPRVLRVGSEAVTRGLDGHPNVWIVNSKDERG